MRIPDSFRAKIPLVFVSFFAFLPVLKSAILVTPISPLPVIENPNANPIATVSFAVQNTFAVPYILDFALEVILWPPEIDDQVVNASATLPTFIPAGGTVNFDYRVSNPNGNPGDCCDPGINPVEFFIELSPMLTQPNQATIVSNGFGSFTVPTNGSSTGVENIAQFNALNNCINVSAANCIATATNGILLFSNGVLGNPYPAVANVTVLDTPEPAAGWLWAAGLALLARRRNRAN
jgi:hypothetical protein